MQRLVFAIVLCSVVILVQGKDENKKSSLKKMFQEIDEELKPTVDACLKENSMTLDDLESYESDDDTPECQWCFLKCFYTNIAFIDEAGKINVPGIEVILELDKVDSDKLKEAKECLEKLDDIVTCKDVQKLDECIAIVDDE